MAPTLGQGGKELVFGAQVLFGEAEGFLCKETVLEAVKASLGHTLFSKEATRERTSFNSTKEGKELCHVDQVSRQK